MKKTIITVFMIIGVLVLGLIVWSLFFSEGGVLQSGWNAVVNQVNSTWQRLTGDEKATLLPKWTTQGDATVGKAGGDVTGGSGGTLSSGN